MGKVRVFISWSGERSKHVASALKDWIGDVIQNTDPFFSAEDIGAGTKWFEVIGKALEGSDFAILCVTRANAKSPWVNFEAGACSKKFEKSRVVPYLIDGEKTDYEPPLTLFQCTKADEQGTFELLKELNKAQEEGAFDTKRLERVFENNWPRLKAQLDSIPEEVYPPEPARTPEDMFAEILGHLRELTSAVQTPTPHEQSLRTFIMKQLLALDSELDSLRRRILEPISNDERNAIALRAERIVERRAVYLAQQAILDGQPPRIQEKPDIEYMQTMGAVSQARMDDPNGPYAHRREKETVVAPGSAVRR